MMLTIPASETEFVAWANYEIACLGLPRFLALLAPAVIALARGEAQVERAGNSYTIDAGVVVTGGTVEVSGDVIGRDKEEGCLT